MGYKFCLGKQRTFNCFGRTRPSPYGLRCICLLNFFRELLNVVLNYGRLSHIKAFLKSILITSGLEREGDVVIFIAIKKCQGISRLTKGNSFMGCEYYYYEESYPFNYILEAFLVPNLMYIILQTALFVILIRGTSILDLM